jgi:hypothetical protein
VAKRKSKTRKYPKKENTRCAAIDPSPKLIQAESAQIVDSVINFQSRVSELLIKLRSCRSQLVLEVPYC